MNLKRMVPVAAAMLAVCSLSFSPVTLAQSGDDELKLWAMLRANADKNTMIRKERFMKMMEARWDMMDKEKKGQLDVQSVRKLVDIDFSGAR